jgi:hypothetical protein
MLNDKVIIVLKNIYKADTINIVVRGYVPRLFSSVTSRGIIILNTNNNKKNMALHASKFTKQEWKMIILFCDIMIKIKEI